MLHDERALDISVNGPHKQPSKVMPPYRGEDAVAIAKKRLLDTQTRNSFFEYQKNEVRQHLLAKSRSSTVLFDHGNAEPRKQFVYNKALNVCSKIKDLPGMKVDLSDETRPLSGRGSKDYSRRNGSHFDLSMPNTVVNPKRKLYESPPKKGSEMESFRKNTAFATVCSPGRDRDFRRQSFLQKNQSSEVGIAINMALAKVVQSRGQQVDNKTVETSKRSTKKYVLESGIKRQTETSF